MTSKTAGLPMLLDERRVVDAIAAQVAILLPKMRASHETLTSMLRERLHRGDLNITMKAVHAVEHEGDWLADSILRATYAEMRNRGEPMSIELQSFGLKAVLRRRSGAGGGAIGMPIESRRRDLLFGPVGLCRIRRQADPLARGSSRSRPVRLQPGQTGARTAQNLHRGKQHPGTYLARPSGNAHAPCRGRADANLGIPHQIPPFVVG